MKCRTVFSEDILTTFKIAVFGTTDTHASFDKSVRTLIRHKYFKF